ncbi:hypothetical protein O3G_MSEX003047 [Manduca sexta]|uniref:THAP-type domain-containing protein n=1 Tax=Manduca sexta TaxID=7130 RepID=A0A921YSQ3_MANSE|nr:hypothetical protein O3G_MSEX003047 [Manduca sexta]
MPYYCTVPRCTSMAGKAKNVSFHQFPRDEELAKLWNKILKRGKPYTKYSKVCSLHFKPEDYTMTSVGKNKGQWRTLRKDAIPSQNLPSDSPIPYQRRQSGFWTANTVTPNIVDPQLQQQMAQAIYMQTMLAMQAAGKTDELSPSNSDGCEGSQTSTDDSDQPETKPTSSRNNSPDHRTDATYKCQDCLKCFKDPDVFTLHKRSHIKREINIIEKENISSTLQANPILANLLKTRATESLDLENNFYAALALNFEYLRNLSIFKSEDCDVDSKLVIDETV